MERERAMTRLLNNGPEEHLDLVEKMQKGLKVALNIMLNVGNFWLRVDSLDLYST